MLGDGAQTVIGSFYFMGNVLGFYVAFCAISPQAVDLTERA
jgi:hypothetical protein